jgi:predicted nucleic acid-binding protein
MKRVLVDTGPIVAILSRRDQYHRSCVEALSNMPGPLFTCWPVITEAAWLLRHDANAVQQLLSSIDTGFLEILQLSSGDAKPIALLLSKYRDLRIQVADAALLHLAGRNEIDTIFTLDARDFSLFRLPKSKSFRIIPEPHQSRRKKP